MHTKMRRVLAERWTLCRDEYWLNLLKEWRNTLQGSVFYNFQGNKHHNLKRTREEKERFPSFIKFLTAVCASVNVRENWMPPQPPQPPQCLFMFRKCGESEGSWSSQRIRRNTICGRGNYAVMKSFTGKTGKKKTHHIFPWSYFDCTKWKRC